jgi:bifunctional non-homologous end joining protein LigD
MWLYEIKADGYRAQVHVNDKKVTVYSRSGYDWTDPFGRSPKQPASFGHVKRSLTVKPWSWGRTGFRTFRRCAVN